MAKPPPDRSPLRAPAIGGGAFAIMACVAVGLALLMLLAGRGALPPMFYAPRAEAAPLGGGGMIKRAVFADGRLWLLSEDGAVWTIRPSGHDAERVAFAGPVQDLCVRDGRVMSVIAAPDGPDQWTLAETSAGGWRDLATIGSRGDRLSALQCEADGALLVTTKRLIEIRGGRVRSANLSEELPVHAVSSVVATPDTIYVGLNAGEWGGGLRRIDRRNGAVALVEARRSQDTCEGPLNADCDPVTAVIPDPTRPDCVLLAIGLVHMQSHGRILEICRDQVRSVYAKPCGLSLTGLSDARSQASFTRCSEAFFGLARSGDTLWAAGNNGLYRLDRDGMWKKSPLPEFKPYGPFRVSFEEPSLVFLLTEANARYSLSGATPLMVAR